MSDDLITWLRGVLEEDERVARGALHGPVEEPWRAIKSRITGSEYDAVGQRGYWHREPDADGLGTFVIADFGACGGSKAGYFLRFQPRQMLADIAAKRAVLDLHSIVWRDIGWLEDDEGELVEATDELPVCGYCVPKHSHFRTRQDVPEGACQTVRLLASAYAERPGYREEWGTDSSAASA